MNWLKRHSDTITIISIILGLWWSINGRFVDLDKRMNGFEKDLARIEKDLAILKTVMIMQKIMPTELAVNANSSSAEASTSSHLVK